MMLVDSTCESEDEVFFGKVTARELNIIKERFLSHLVPRQLEEPFQSHSDSELETCDKINNPNIFTNSSREYECIDWYSEEEFREKYKTYPLQDVIDFELSFETISDNNKHKISNKEVPTFQDNGFQVISSKKAKYVISKSFNYHSRIRGPLSSSTPCNLSKEDVIESSYRIYPKSEHYLEEKTFLINKDEVDCKISDEPQILNKSNNFSVRSDDFRNKISVQRISRGKRNLKLSIAKEESDLILDVVASTEVKDERPKSTSRKEVIKDTHRLEDDLTSVVIREEALAKCSIEDSVKISHYIKNFQKTPRIILNRIDLTLAKSPQKPNREITVSKPRTPCVSLGKNYSHGASAKKKFSHIQSPVAAYIRNQSSQAFNTPAKQPRLSQTFRTPIKRTRDEQVLPTSSRCEAIVPIPKVLFPKIPKVNYDRVHSICPTDGTVAKKIPKKPRKSNPKVIKHTGRLVLIPLVKEQEEKLEPAELSIVLNRDANFSDTIDSEIEKTTP